MFIFSCVEIYNDKLFVLRSNLCVYMVFTSREKAFCVLEYARTNSNKIVQRAFVRKFSKKSPTAEQIWNWKNKFEDEGCLCRAKGSGRPATAEGKVERIL